MALSFEQLAGEVLDLLSPLPRYFDSPENTVDLFNRLGLNPNPAALSTATQDLAQLGSDITALMGRLTLYLTSSGTRTASDPELRRILDEAQKILDRVWALPARLTTLALPPDFVESLLGLLLVEYLGLRHPGVLRALVLLGAIESTFVAANATTGPAVGYVRVTFRWNVLAQFLRDPRAWAAATYGWGSATFDSRLLLLRLSALADSIGLWTRVGYVPAPVIARFYPSAPEPARTLALKVPFYSAEIFEQAQAEVGAMAMPVEPQAPRGAEDTGLCVMPYADGVVEGTRAITPQTDLLFRGSASVAGGAVFALRPYSGIEAALLTDVAAQGDVRIELQRKPAGGATAITLVGDPKTTRIDAARLSAYVQLLIATTGAEFVAGGDVVRGSLTVAAGDQDGFLQAILPSGGVSMPFEVGLLWSSTRGLLFSGAAGLDISVPVGKDVAGLLRIEQVHLALKADGSGLHALAGATIGVQLGPIAAAVERFGVRVALTFPARGGNLGLAHLELAAQPPSGAGLKIDAGVVSGGGYLLFDPAREQYSGAVHLEIARQVSVNAFGLLTTRMPDGSKGFSLLVLISAQFPGGIPLAYGFTLHGIGGLLGVNRTVAVDTLRAGLRAGTIGRILFPDDPIRNAPQIVSDLGRVFPPAAGRFVFGPMVQIGWGTPKTVLTIDLGLVLELPAPVRLLILGRLRLLLPEEQTPVIRLQLDALGVIDFESGDVALDAVLYDSTITQFAVTGEMALRANFGAAPSFALAVGGFHPRFQPPHGFPPLERVAISLAAGSNPRLRLEAYLALTSNTVQFGAHVDLYAEAAGFSLQGALGFDTLIQFSPFGLIADLRALVALKRGNTSIMAVMLDVTVTGPAPWRAQGRASFTILFLSGSIRFDVQVGRSEPPPLPPPVEVLPLLRKVLGDPGSWGTQLPPGEHPIAALRRDPAAPDWFVHPLANLEVRQRVVPLGREITRFGAADIDGDRVFTLAVVGPDDTPLSDTEADVRAVDDFFAPAQFRAMTDDEKLVAPAFESMQAGIRFSLRAYTSGPGRVAEEGLTYERKTVYAPAPATAAPARASLDEAAMASREPAAIPRIVARPDRRGEPPFVLRPGLVDRVAATGSASSAGFARTGAAKYAGAPRHIALRPPRYVAVTGLGTAARRVALPVKPGKQRPDASYSEAAEAIGRHRPRERRQRSVKVVPSYVEVVP